MKFGRLTMQAADVGRNNQGRVLSLWFCDCGGSIIAPRSRVAKGQPKSCGCLAAERNKEQATKHGGKGTREYNSWSSMRRRCLSPDDKDFPRYGGRGIKICDQWSNFAEFLSDMGSRPEGMCLERIDTMGDYEPGNVVWANHTAQARNRRSSLRWQIKGKTFESIADAASHFDVSEQTIHRWVNGQFDARRGTFTAPVPECVSEMKYP